MLTIFTVPKPFVGHIGTIQRNAIRSWIDLTPSCQVILCGEEEGTVEVAHEMEVEVILNIARNTFGTPQLDSVFQQAERHAAHQLLCYANCDIILPRNFCSVVGRARDAYALFLLVGQTRRVSIAAELTSATARADILQPKSGRPGLALRPPSAMDYFVFPRGMLGTLPPFAVGRPTWDNWMIFTARSRRIPVIDATGATMPLHQDHQYGHVSDVRGTTWDGPEADANRKLLGVSFRNTFSIADATHALTSDGLTETPWHLAIKSRMRTELLLSPRRGRFYGLLHAVYRRYRPA